MFKATERYSISKSAHCYQLCEWIEGGKESKNPRTGEVTITKEGWKKHDVYYANLKQMVAHIAKIESDKNAKDLFDWLKLYESKMNEIDSNLIIANGC